ncbi:hypothetical protein SmJEL517_g04475 [Synchytrium microbalum]|uniref:Uncharacterized protein n=1 Tax=Synchytrium microbalum TaxID=1806994 RepID=A0A507BZA5_9FUNG|nr:uncharacterized protein SmJEL517_g04475 [Synchytrium microbalum]TPX32461.1 hypothetical protein SmJEL517_g04475 [Synchytrium microbalum]
MTSNTDMMSPPLADLLGRNLKRTHELYKSTHGNPLPDDPKSQRLKLTSKILDEYDHVKQLPKVIQQQAAQPKPSVATGVNGTTTTSRTSTKISSTTTPSPSTDLGLASGSSVQSILDTMPAAQMNQQSTSSSALTIRSEAGTHKPNAAIYDTQSNSLIKIKEPRKVPKPEWHAPWRLMRVISGHLGWVRAVTVDVSNEWFVTGAGDRVIKIWDLASGTLKLTLTGHISTVRGLAVSPRHPYLFSCGEDKMVKCWDLETNKVIRHYHGHLSGVYALALHPTLDVLITGGRDSSARVWDMRTKAQIFALTGHSATVTDIKTQEADPQLITASNDTTIRLWDLAAGKTMTTLTHHKKSVRALAMHPTEFSFASASPDNIKQWKFPGGNFIQNLDGHQAIVNTMSCNKENVLFSGADNGSMHFWDWKSGYNFQTAESAVQPGSLESEAGIFCSTFDRTGSRLITGEADKTIKIWKEDENATPETHPITNWKPALARQF